MARRRAPPKGGGPKTSNLRGAPPPAWDDFPVDDLPPDEFPVRDISEELRADAAPHEAREAGRPASQPTLELPADKTDAERAEPEQARGADPSVIGRPEAPAFTTPEPDPEPQTNADAPRQTPLPGLDLPEAAAPPDPAAPAPRPRRRRRAAQSEQMRLWLDDDPNSEP